MRGRGVRLALGALVLLPALAAVSAKARSRPDREWRVYGGDLASTRYSPLDQIRRSNVGRLRPAWTFHCGDLVPGRMTTLECNPIVVDGVMYVTSPTLKAIALKAGTGEKLWEFDPRQTDQRASRGVTYWEGGGQKRIFFTASNWLYGLDATTGRPDPGFGDGGKVNMREGLGRDVARMRLIVSTPGVIYGDLLILGSSVGEGPESAVPGSVRAYDVRTGRQVWIFHTIPEPGEFGHETWSPESWKTAGAANCWGGMSLDPKRGVVYLAIGSPAYDFFGGDRRGQNLFGNCVVALKAETGKRLWHFQTVHHDLWDYDLPCPPILASLKIDGKKRDAVAQVTKTGLVFVLDRDTGQPLFPVEERPVPASELEDEVAHPTQPFPVKPPPFVRHGFTEADATDLSPRAREFVLEQLRKVHKSAVYTPPSREGTVILPGFHGGANWSGASFDPTTGRLFVNANEIPFLMTMKAAASGGAYRYLSTGYFRFLDPDGFPAVKPPWGTLTAVDLNRGEIAWKIPLGEYPDLKARGVPPTGTENFGGSIVTAGGLVFIGATKDRRFRAFDRDTGKVLWETELETGGNATPCTYEVDGKQYVVIAAGGGLGQRAPEQRENPPGDAYVAFALP